MSDNTAPAVGTKVTYKDGSTAVVTDAPYRAASGVYVQVKWDSNMITASGYSNVAVEDITTN